ncbi:MAG: ribonuclease HI family protein [Candidatus Magasanikbacteria bacterium]|nr:ribonuclease HI family protein [Candidatus Magasanikbacteria bacterium]
MKLKIYSDGGARGNPGPSATGVVIKNKAGKIVAEYGEYLGKQTNNFAEYSAFISGLKKAKILGATEVESLVDSQLLEKQMKREWKVKEPTLQKLFVEGWNAMQEFKKVEIKHIRREFNKEADAWVNKILDQQK